MLATLVAEAFHRHGWVYEEKLDGWRIVADQEGPRVWLVSRTGRDHAGRFPAVAEAIRRLPAATLILDDEIARFDENLVSRFHLLHEETGELATPPVFVTFGLSFGGAAAISVACRSASAGSGFCARSVTGRSFFPRVASTPTG